MFVESEGVFGLNEVEKREIAGATIIIPVEHMHAIKAHAQLIFIDGSNGQPLVEGDIERY